MSAILTSTIRPAVTALAATSLPAAAFLARGLSVAVGAERRNARAVDGGILGAAIAVRVADESGQGWGRSIGETS